MLKNIYKFIKKNSLLLLAIVAAVLYKWYEKYLVASSNKKVEKAEKKDEKIQEKQEILQKKAENHIKNAENLEKKAESVKVDLDWHLKE